MGIVIDASKDIEMIYYGKVVKTGNGAMIYSLKKHIGKEVIVIIKKTNKVKENGKE
jgi:putative transposon-encoded protein